MTEWELIEQLKLKDERAFKTIVDSWQDMVYNTVIGIVQSAEDAEDVTQEVFIQVYESIQSFKGDSKFSTWVYRIAVTKSLDHLRRKKRKKRFAFVQSLFGKNDELVNDPPDFFHPGVVAENKENSNVLFKAIATLPQNQNVAFVLNKVEGLTYQQISEVMKISESAVDSLLQRAKTNLKKNLETYYHNYK
ncbi:MAG: RNA polymerase sigma factor [Chitinophagaceae bacterium]|nr:RNA polymerase sigma factor [Chitinophagaceae bacterium]